MSKKPNNPPKKCVSEAQKKAIRRKYYELSHRAEPTSGVNKRSQQTVQTGAVNEQGQQAAPPEFPKRFPFWARLKISKNRTTLVIDKAKVPDKRTKKLVDGLVHREATSKYHKGFEEISPNPDKEKRPEPMYLKSPRKLPKHLFKPHNKQLEMPEHLRKRYDKNNDKNDGDN